MTEEELIAFEKDIADEYNKGVIKAPVHLSGGNEKELIGYFASYFQPGDWVFSTWRSHYHALLAGIPPSKIRDAILKGRSITLAWPEHCFLSSAIVGGILPIALGVALGLRRTDTKSPNIAHVFIGDMTAKTGAYHEAFEYAAGHDLPIQFVVEDNGKSVKTNTISAWRSTVSYPYEERHIHENPWPHSGTGTWVNW